MRTLLLVCLLATTLAGVANAGENRLFLDFNRDGDLRTIEDRSFADRDTVTLILEFQRIPTDFEFRLTYDTDCGVIVDDYGGTQYRLPAEISWDEGTGCNEEILSYCYWNYQVCNFDCTCYQPEIILRIDEHAPLNLYQRYELATFLIRRHYYSGRGRLRVTNSEFSEDQLESNDVLIGPEVLPVVGSTWGRVKAEFRPE